MGMTNRVALVLGGGRGIGRAIATRLASEGCRVTIASRSGDELDRIIRDAERDGLPIGSHVTDITDPTQVAAAVEQVLARHGQLDIAVNSAGTSYIAPLLLGKVDRWEEVLRVNLLGAFTFSQAVLRPMVRAKYGRIVHIGSIGAEIGMAYNAIYAASKAGLCGLIRSLALEVAATGITANVVQPGTVETELAHETHGKRASMKGVSVERQLQDVAAQSPLGRLVTADEVAEAVVFLGSDAASGITGQVLNVDGGRTIA